MTETTEPATSPYAAAVSAPVAKKAHNKLGFAALIIVLVAAIVPPVAFIVAVIATLVDPNVPESMDLGWTILGAFVISGLSFGVTGPIALVGVILGIVSLFRKGRSKAVGIVSIVIGTPLAVIGLSVLPLLTGDFFRG